MGPNSQLTLYASIVQLLRNVNSSSAAIADMTQFCPSLCLVKQTTLSSWEFYWCFHFAECWQTRSSLTLREGQFHIRLSESLLPWPFVSILFLRWWEMMASFPLRDESACVDERTEHLPWFTGTVNLCQEGKGWPNSFSLAGEKEGREWGKEEGEGRKIKHTQIDKQKGR